MTFRMGCAIWAYKGWVGDLFPTGSSPSQFLQLYSQRFTTVEVNATFYAVPNAATVARWAQETPTGFKFCPKLPRTITHAGPLQPKIDEALRFIDLMQGLGDRLGPIFAQLPPTFGPKLFPDLAAFLTGLSDRNLSLALEVRHPQWFEPEPAAQLNELLQQFAIGRVLLDTRPIYECDDNPQLTSERRKPRLPLQPVVTAPFTIIRYISHPDQPFNHTFMEDWVMHLQNWLPKNICIYLFIHCPIEEHSPQNALYFHGLLEDHALPISPPPWKSLPKEPMQMRLF